MLRLPIGEIDLPSVRFFDWLVRIEVIALVLAEVLDLVLEVRARNSMSLHPPCIFAERIEKFFPRDAAVYMFACRVEVFFRPLQECFRHRLPQRSQFDILHWWRHHSLSLLVPCEFKLTEIIHDAFRHEIIEELPLVFIPIKEKLMSEIIHYGMILIVP